MDTNPLNVEDNLNGKIALFQEIKVDIRSLPFRKYIFKRHRTNNNLSSTFNYLIRWISEICGLYKTIRSFSSSVALPKLSKRPSL